MADIIRETFEGAGQPSGWSVEQYLTGSVDWDYATSPAPLAGGRSLRIASSGWWLAYRSFGSSTVCAYFMFCASTVPGSGNHSVFEMYSSSYANLCDLHFSVATGYLAVTDPVKGEQVSSYAISSGTIYHVWIEYNLSGAWKVFINTSPAKPASPAISFTGGSTTSVAFGGFSAQNGGVNICDNLLVCDTQIGSYPFSPFPPHFARKQNILLRR